MASPCASRKATAIPTACALTTKGCYGSPSGLGARCSATVPTGSLSVELTCPQRRCRAAHSGVPTGGHSLSPRRARTIPRRSGPRIPRPARSSHRSPLRRRSGLPGPRRSAIDAFEVEQYLAREGAVGGDSKGLFEVGCREDVADDGADLEAAVMQCCDDGGGIVVEAARTGDHELPSDNQLNR